MVWARRMDEGPKLDENEEPGARLGRISPSGWENRRSGASSGRRVEMLLDPVVRRCNATSIHVNRHKPALQNRLHDIAGSDSQTQLQSVHDWK
jgi:hypothetical protein